MRRGGEKEGEGDPEVGEATTGDGDVVELSTDGL